ncbi:aldo-keto reductase family 1 member A1-B isoform X2 [Thalassophryne amazonica]|uniref:aldo-keto reductase family 1 member A1-B isoform X2 n=1 Tax=Thalassophryne amazonica TaxID=390379 RepID=UPI001472364A|nr:aldo-keto reductase family 1 member A1-B isoform X2 [Thalassophryne amazonica]
MMFLKYQLLKHFRPFFFDFRKRVFLGDMIDYAILNTGQKMPLIGLGTWKSEPGKVKQAVTWALKAGYRHIDCATIYANEAEIGESLEEALGPGKALRREDVFVTSKLWNTQHHPEDVEPALLMTLKDLKLKYLDLYLMHWPHAFQRGDVAFPKKEDGTMLYDNIDYKLTWAAMEKLVGKGLVRAIGLSNFNKRQIDDILSVAIIAPAVVQVESHPYLAQTELMAHCRNQGLVMTAYSPLGSPDRAWKDPKEPVVLEEPVIAALAAKYNKSVAQIVLRWQTQRGVVTIPKSVTESRIRENIQVFDFMLETQEMQSITALNKGWRYIVPMIQVGEERVPRDAGHPHYPFNDPY